MSNQTQNSTALPIRNVCVIGAGTMGGGISAHLANLGFDVTLLDARLDIALAGLERARQARPPAFYMPDRAAEVRVGDTEENLQWAAEADWVCEAIYENLDAKKALFARLDPVLRPDAMVSTNTSGLQIQMLAEGRSPEFRRKFLGTHFFNPPRYLKLLELIPTAETDPSIVRAMGEFLEDFCGRRVVMAKDTPGFIANRYGMWAMFKAIHVAERLHLTVEQVDAITGVFLGRPRSGSFRLADIVGIDVMRDIAANLIERCSDDPFVETLRQPSSMVNLLARGWIGDKTGQGYYRKEGSELLALDLQTFAYRQRREPDIPSVAAQQYLPLAERVSGSLDLRDEAGEFLREYLLPALRYANYLKDKISYSVEDFDNVMRWGFGWELGPFALIDAIGSDRVGIESKPFYKGNTLLGFDGKYHKLRSPEKYAPLSDYPIIETGAYLTLRDLGEGVTSVGLASKMGIIGPELMEELAATLEGKVQDRFVLTSEARSFSAGFDLKYFANRIQVGDYAGIERGLEALQGLAALLSSRKCVAAVFGHVLGAGLELALGCPRMVAAAESQIGFPESRVGLLPGGGGTTQMRLYNQHSAKRLAEVVLNLGLGTISQGADHARSLGFLRATDDTCNHPDRLIHDAKKLVLSLEEMTAPEWRVIEGPLVGIIDREIESARASGAMTDYDAVISDKIKLIFAKSANAEVALTRERAEFIDLCSKSLTQARIRHMLEHGKPLRN